jgi:Dolichyl-phosphate-mannose-protein mannosyltransferase
VAASSGRDRNDLDQILRSRSAGLPAAAPPSVRASAPSWWRAAAGELSPRLLWRKHRIFSILVLLSLIPRVLAELAFRPAMLIADSYQYMQLGAQFALGRLRPSGYPALLRILLPLHSLPVITTLQHLLGIGVAVIVYGLLRGWGLPGWGAALATVPTLFDPRQIALESYILPDALFGFVVIAVVVVLLTRRKPSGWQCAVAGLGIGYAALLRGDGLPLIVPVLAYMLVRRVGWRSVAAGAAAFAVPVLGYAFLFYVSYGTFSLTNSDGLFLWARTMSFANCKTIKPPADLAPLCPDRQGVATKRASPADYLWSPRAWWIRRDAGRPGPTPAENALAMRFALDAIKAQPMSYVREVSIELGRAFTNTHSPQMVDELAFSQVPAVPVLPPNYARYLRAYTRARSNQHAVRPYARMLLQYQKYVYFPGPALLAVLLAGLAGVIWNWRRWGGPAALPWTMAVVLLVVPVALSEYLYRYAIVAVPLACLATGLGFVPAIRHPDRAARQEALPTLGGQNHAIPGAGIVTEDHGNAG